MFIIKVTNENSFLKKKKKKKNVCKNARAIKNF